MAAVAELKRVPPPRPETFTTSGLLLRQIFEYLGEKHESSVTLPSLADEVFFREMRQRYGPELYDATLTSDGHVYSSELANDVGTLLAAGYIELIPEGRVALTPTGRRRAEEIHPPL